MQVKPLKIVECPRDAMQGIHDFIPTELKAQYLNALLKVGFDTLDFGSFVSPRAIPQMKDTSDVLSLLDLDNTDTKLLAIVANLRGSTDALEYHEIDYLGFPFSVSAEFQKRNTNKDQELALHTLSEINELCAVHDKKLVVYMSMAFGNPYGEQWHPEIVAHWTDRVISSGVGIVSLADTVGAGAPEVIGKMVAEFSEDFNSTEIGVHLHTRADNWEEKVAAAYDAGCKRFDGALRGYGGCPMAKDDLVGNLATENLVKFLEGRGNKLGFDMAEFAEALKVSGKVFA